MTVYKLATHSQLLCKYLFVVWRWIHCKALRQKLVSADGLSHKHSVTSSSKLCPQESQTQDNCKFHDAEKDVKAEDAQLQGFMILESLTGNCLSQDELHLLFGSLFGVFNQFVDSVSSGMEPGRTASFRQGHLPPTLHHNCVLWT